MADRKDIFLRIKRVVKANPNQTLVLSDLAEIEAEDSLQKKLEEIEIKEVTKKENQSMIITALEVINLIKDEFPELEIEHLGEADIVIDIVREDDNSNNEQRSKLYVFVVAIILFFGSGMAIMNFHADVSMIEVHQQLYELIIGEFKEQPFLLQIPYSLGLASGMIIFFNSFYKYKFNDDPSPLEVEMYLYESNVNQFSLDQKEKQARRDKKKSNF